MSHPMPMGVSKRNNFMSGNNILVKVVIDINTCIHFTNKCIAFVTPIKSIKENSAFVLLKIMGEIKCFLVDRAFTSIIIIIIEHNMSHVHL